MRKFLFRRDFVLSKVRGAETIILFKAAIFGFLLSIAASADFSFFLTSLFLLVSFYLYTRPFFGSYHTWYAFFALLILSILGMKILSGTILWILGLFLFSFIFYLLLGIKEYLFVKRSRLYYVIFLPFLYTLFISFFLSDKSQFFFLKYMGVALAIFLLLREWLGLIPSFHFPRRELIVSLVIAFVVAQAMWAVALLPIGFISASNFMILLVFVLGDLTLKHFTGGISKIFLFQHLIFFILLTSLIFWSSNWVI